MAKKLQKTIVDNLKLVTICDVPAVTSFTNFLHMSLGRAVGIVEFFPTLLTNLLYRDSRTINEKIKRSNNSKFLNYCPVPNQCRNNLPMDAKQIQVQNFIHLFDL